MRYAIALFAVLALAAPMWGQFNSSMQGTVTDPTGAVLPNASVSLTNQQTNQQFHTKTNGSGQYRFESLGPGNYQLAVSAEGFQAQQIKTVLTTEQTSGVDVKLNLASSTNTVQVSAHSPALNTQETRVQTTISAAQLRTLPLQNRGTLNIMNAAPGVSGFTEGLDNFANEEKPNGSANGHFYGSNLYIIDGIPSASNVTGGTNNITPNPDSLQEIALQTNTFSPEYAGGAGVTVEMTTKSGANKFHGAGEISYYNQDLEARSYFVKKVAPFKQLEYSGVFGGPIWKDRTFFFASVEKKAATNPASTGFFATEDPGFLGFLQKNFPNTIGTKLLTTYPTRGINYQGIKFYTTPDLTTQCATPSGACNIPYIDNASQTTAPYNNGTQYSVRIDQLFRHGMDRIYGYYFHIDHEVQVIDPRPQFSSTNNTNSDLASFNYTHIFTPNLLNQASFAYDTVDGTDTASVPTIPDISINNATGINGFGGAFGPGTFVQHNYSWRDVLTYVRGRHDLKFGFQAFYGNDSADFSGIYARPSFGFNSLADFVNDNVFSEGNITYNPLTGGFKPLQFGVSGKNYGAYVQDSWKVTPKLTLDLGVRWDDFGNPGAYGYSTYTKVANLIPAGNTTALLSGMAIDGQFANASIRSSKNVYNHDLNNNWAPRIGFAYAPAADGKTSIHGGVGLYYDEITFGQIIDQLRGNPPGWIYPSFGQTQAIPAIYSLGTTNKVPYGFVYPTVPATGLDAHGGLPGANAGVQGLDPNVKTPPTLNYTLGVSQEMAANIVMGVTYTGSYSWNQITATDFNRSAGDLIRNKGTLKRLNPSFGSIIYAGNFDTGKYNSVIFSMRQQIGKLDYQASYTWSHALDYGTCNTRQDFNGGLDCPADQHLIGVGYYGDSSFDEPNNFKLTGSYELPSPAERFLKPVLGGWQVTSLVVFQSGTPFTAEQYNGWGGGATDGTYTGTDGASHPCIGPNGAFGSVQCGDYNADGYGNDLPNVATNKRGGSFTERQFINGVFAKDSTGATTDFTAPLPGTEGNEARNIFRNPRLMNIDASVLKNTAMPWFKGDKSNLQLRVDSFNVLNHTQLHPVDYNVGSPTFGQSTSTLQPRIIQLGARFEF